MLFYFEEHTSVILKNFKIEKSNGGFLRNFIKSQRKWLFFKKMSRMIILTHLTDQMLDYMNELFNIHQNESGISITAHQEQS